MKNKRKILLIEPDRHICERVRSLLELNGYDVLTANAGSTAKGIAESHCPDLVLLSPVLPDVDGMTLLRDIREWSDVPVIIITEQADELTAVEAFENGADDCILRTIGTKELLSRIKVAFRHCYAGNSGDVIHDDLYKVGSLVIDYGKYRAYIAGKDAELTQNEFKIVALLGKFAGKVLPYEYIITQLWGPNARGDNQILRVNMANIRRKIEENTSRPRYIFTEVGVGYRMAEK